MLDTGLGSRWCPDDVLMRTTGLCPVSVSSSKGSQLWVCFLPALLAGHLRVSQDLFRASVLSAVK